MSEIPEIEPRKVGGSTRWPSEPELIEVGQSYEMSDPHDPGTQTVVVKSIAELSNGGYAIVRGSEP
ncbi:hypothetical protein C5B89_06615 [Haloferax sp. Atlit-47N]|uniref:hypothetical protein n=1 Tax=Haloferax sp. Atlit-47N TaxID=2077199 RepID=UPI000E2371EB|nr:hypothetical protein [Haloferax sp. Atlit-47N]RDZ41609.1 hypothetical protein C5B89_06615 [Haloferax sp. Atlit-47N]